MRRQLAATTRMVMLGAATTTAVAWMCAIAVDVPGQDYGTGARRAITARTHIDPNPVASRGLEPFESDVPGQPSVYATRWSGFGSAYWHSGTSVAYFPAPPGAPTMDGVVPRSLRAQITPWLTGDASWPGTDVARFHGARGWPFLALWCEFITTPSLPWNGRPSGGIELPWPGVQPGWYLPPPPKTALPLRPLWTGFAADTLVFAATWWLLHGGGRRWRASRRRRRNMCARCGYDLRGTEPPGVCPECGGSFGAVADRVHCPA